MKEFERSEREGRRRRTFYTGWRVKFLCSSLDEFVSAGEWLILKPYRNRRVINTIVARTLFHTTSIIIVVRESSYSREYAVLIEIQEFGKFSTKWSFHFDFFQIANDQRWTCAWRNSKRSFFEWLKLWKNDENHRVWWFHFDMIRFKLNSQFLFLFFFLIGEFTIEIISVFPFLLEKYSNIFISFFLRKIFSIKYSRYTLTQLRLSYISKELSNHICMASVLL